MQKIDFAMGGGYPAYIGRGAYQMLGSAAARRIAGRRAAILTDDGVPGEHTALCRAELERFGFKTELLAIPSGERNKTLKAVSAIYSFLYEKGFTRSDCVVGVGGGVPLDIAGFAAATYMRGVGFISVPTTLISQTDSAYGGKTGVDYYEGKNLIGCFSHPRAVVCETAFLRTLPERELICGMGEVIKYGAIAEPGLLEGISRGVPDDEVIAECVRIKRRFAEEDEFDTGVRRTLNFGHTLGHAFEAASGYETPHGQAVASGMLAAIRLGERLGVTAAGVYPAVAEACERAGLDTRFDGALNGALTYIRRDKKSDGQRIAFVLLEDLGRPVIRALRAEEISSLLGSP